MLSFGKKDEKQFSKTAMFKGGRTWGGKAAECGTDVGIALVATPPSRMVSGKLLL